MDARVKPAHDESELDAPGMIRAAIEIRRAEKQPIPTNRKKF
jgi:hypothetical protein